MRSRLFIFIISSLIFFVFLLLIFRDESGYYDTGIIFQQQERIPTIENNIDHEDSQRKISSFLETMLDSHFFPMNLYARQGSHDGEKKQVKDYILAKDVRSSKVYLYKEPNMKRELNYFILVPSLAPKEKNCFSLAFVEKMNHYLTLEDSTLQIREFVDVDNFRKNSTFCFYEAYEQVYSDKIDVIIKDYYGHNLIYKLDTKKLFLSISTLKEQDKERNGEEKIFSLKKKSNSLKNYTFRYKELDSLVSQYSFDNLSKTFKTSRDFFPDSSYYQPHLLKVIHYTKDDKISEKQPKDNRLKVSIKDSIVTTRNYNVYYLLFIPIRPLLKSAKENCFSFAVLEKFGFYLVQRNKQLFVDKYTENMDFEKRATFCLEKDVNNLYRILDFEQSLYADHHSFFDQFISLLQDNRYEKNKSLFMLTPFLHKQSKRHFNILEVDSGTQKRYIYNQSKEKFIKVNSEENRREYDVILNSDFYNDEINRIKCELYSEKDKIYYASKDSSSVDVLFFDIDENDLRFMKGVKCSLYGKNGVEAKIICDNVSNSININKECSLKYYFKNKYYSFPKGKWDNISLQLFSVKLDNAMMEMEQAKVEAVESDKKKKGYFASKEYFDKLTSHGLKSFSVTLASSRVRNISDYQCQVLINDTSYKVYFAKINKKSDKSIISDVLFMFQIKESDYGLDGDFICDPRKKSLKNLNCKINIDGSVIVKTSLCEV